MMKVFAFALLLFTSLHLFAEPVRVEGVRMAPAPDKTRLVFDLSGPVKHSVFTLVSPQRVVLDLEHAKLPETLPQPGPTDIITKRIRSGVKPDGNVRIVLDLKRKVRPQSFMLKPDEQHGYRLVLDLHTPESAAELTPVVKQRRPARLRDVVIAIDAGHGGADPGATGATGIREKDVVLEIARELQRLVSRERGMHPVMVRDGDQYLKLRKRINKARAYKADFFISIHADAFKDPRVQGSSVYTLSQGGASSEAARWLAERENAADLIGGVSLDDKDELLASVLLDLSQTATIEASIGVGEEVLKGLKQLGKVHKKSVQQAGFAVLKSPDIPSILVETAFISNPQDERRLKDKRHQRKVARAILEGLREYFADNAPPGSLLAQRKHVISPGDTLSELAERYGVSMDRIRRVNAIQNANLRIGQVLEIPSS